MSELVKIVPTDHQLQTDFHSKHMEYHEKFPEKFGVEGDLPSLPTYFGNVCLRLIPVFDIVIHRY